MRTRDDVRNIVTELESTNVANNTSLEYMCTDNVRSMYQSTSRNDDVDRDKRPEPRIFMHSDRAFMMQLTTMVTYEWRPVVTLIETDEKMSPSPVQALYAKLYANISPGRVFHDILHASKSAIDRNVNSVLSRKWLMDVRTSMAQRRNDYNALPEDVLDHSSHDATYENRYDAAAKNGDAAAKNGDAAAKNGDAAAKNGDAAAKNGNAAAKNGNAAAKNGDAAAKNGDAAAKNGDAAAKNGDAAAKNGNAAAKNGDAAAKNGDAAAKNGDAAAKNGDAAAKNGDAAAKNGDAAAKNGDAAAKNGDAAAKNGDAAAKNGDAAAKNGNAAAKNGDAAAKNGDAAAKNGDAAAKNDDAAAKNGGRILWNNSGNDTDRGGPNVRNDDYSRATVDDETIE